jgi:hypothetical protein
MTLADDFNLNVGQPPMLHTQLDGCGVGKIKNPAIHVGPAIGDTHMNMPSIGQVDDSYDATEWHGSVGGSQCLHVEDFAVCRLPPMKLLPVPGGDTTISNADIKSGITFWNPRTRP